MTAIEDTVNSLRELDTTLTKTGTYSAELEIIRNLVKLVLKLAYEVSRLEAVVDAQSKTANIEEMFARIFAQQQQQKKEPEHKEMTIEPGVYTTDLKSEGGEGDT